MVATNGIHLHTVQAGPREGPLVILLHGFPEFWYGWRRQIPELARAGFRVWAPDLRGYGESSKPAGVRSYTIDRIAADVEGLIEAAGRERAVLVGHDWGGAVGWWLAARKPERVERLVVLNCPHPRVMRRNVLTNPAQTLRSAYAIFFQIPRLPERLLAASDHRRLVAALRSTSRPGAFSDDDIERYREAWRQPGALPAMINWYRAFSRRPARSGGRRGGDITVPTLLLWGTRDRFLGREMAEQSIALCRRGTLEWVRGASHWVQHEEPELVNARIIAFASGHPTP